MRGYRSIYRSEANNPKKFTRAVEGNLGKQILVRHTMAKGDMPEDMQRDNQRDKSFEGTMEYGEESPDNPYIRFTPLDGSEQILIPYQKIRELEVLEP